MGAVKNEVEDILVLEARLLDDWQLVSWLDLFTEDGVYWIPIEETADPIRESSIVYDDRVHREMRVHQLLHEERIAQLPQSSTLRHLSQIEITSHDDDEVRARYNVIIHELRGGDWRQSGLGELRTFVGCCKFSLRRVEGKLKLSEKRVVLINRQNPLGGLSFIL